MMKFTAIALAALLLAATPAAAASTTPEKYTFDPAHTQVMFSVSHLGMSHSHGRFGKFDGYFTFDVKKPETSVIDVTIDATSIDMGSKEWEDHICGADFLNTDKFPKMTFKSTAVKRTGPMNGTVTGDLTLLGVTKPVTLDVTFNKAGRHPYMKNLVAGFSINGKLNRADFGMAKHIPDVGDEVKIMIEVEGIRQDFEGMNAK